MAFGKDTSVLNKIASKGTYGGGTFGQRVNDAQKSRYGSSSGNKRRGPPPFITQFRPSLGTPDRIRVLLGNYVNETYDKSRKEEESAGFGLREDPFLIIADHYHAGFRRGSLCSGGEAWFDTDRARPCVCCEINREDRARRREEAEQSGDEAEDEEERLVSRQRKFVFSIFDYGKYHEVPAMKDGVEHINQHTKKPYMNWVKCARTQCEHCRDRRTVKEGHLSHWPLNSTQLRILMHAHNESAGRHCKLCKGANSIVGRTWMCPGCHSDVIDLATTRMTREEVEEATMKERYTCKCGFHGFLVETVACEACFEEGFAGEAPQGIEATSNMRATIFDVDIDVSMVPGENNQKVLQISNVTAPVAIPERFVKLAKPMDLHNIYMPDDYQSQCMKFDVTYVPPPQVPAAFNPARVYLEEKARAERAKGYSR